MFEINLNLKPMISANEFSIRIIDQIKDDLLESGVILEKTAEFVDIKTKNSVQETAFVNLRIISQSSDLIELCVIDKLNNYKF